MKTQIKTENVLTITRIFDAPREHVWKAWTQPEQMMRWWGPKGFTAPVCKVELRLGGKYLCCMRSPEGKDYWSTGVYREIVPQERIICTDCIADEKGNVVPATYYGMRPDFPLELQITMTLEEYAGKTRMTLRHTGLPQGEMTDMCRQGWSESFDKLAESLKEEYPPAIETNSGPVIKEVILNASVPAVWKAITDRDDMKQWYFDIEEFRPEAGFEFNFLAGDEKNKYLHLCRITEVVPNKKLAYSWRYQGHTAETFVTFELFAQGDKTRVKLTHEGLERIADQGPAFARQNFVDGWNQIIGTSLKKFVEE